MPKANKKKKIKKKEAKQQSPIVPDEIQKVIQNLDEDSKINLLHIYTNIFTPIVTKLSKEGEGEGGVVNNMFKGQMSEIKKFHDRPCPEDEKLARVIGATNKLTQAFSLLDKSDLGELTGIVNSTSQKNIPMESLKRIVHEYAMKKIDNVMSNILGEVFQESNSDLIHESSNYLFTIIEQLYE